MQAERCECSDPECLVHKGHSRCKNRTGKGWVCLFRVDIIDQTGTIFCLACAADAMESGLFTDLREGAQYD